MRKSSPSVPSDPSVHSEGSTIADEYVPSAFSNPLLCTNYRLSDLDSLSGDEDIDHLAIMLETTGIG